MAMSLSALAFTIDAGGAIRLDAPADVDATTWQFGVFAPAPRFRLAVAVRRSGRSSHTAPLVLRSAADAG
jgi:hypothetical protein